MSGASDTVGRASWRIVACDVLSACLPLCPAYRTVEQPQHGEQTTIDPAEANSFISWAQDISCDSPMSEIDVVTVSSRGQVSIPADVRRDLGLEEGAKLLVVSKGDNILLKKVDESFIDKSLEDVLKPMWEDARNAGLDEEDAGSLIYEHRQKD